MKSLTQSIESWFFHQKGSDFLVLTVAKIIVLIDWVRLFHAINLKINGAIVIHWCSNICG
jgi:hypothetical protein